MWGLIVGIILGVIALIAIIGFGIYHVNNNKDEKRGVGYTIWALVGAFVGAVIAGLFSLFGGMHTIKNNEIAIVRNVNTGEIRIDERAGLHIYNPLEKLYFIPTTLTEIDLGNEDQDKGVEGGYKPFNISTTVKTGDGTEKKISYQFSVATNIKWGLDFNHKEAAMKLYQTTGGADIRDGKIISTIEKNISSILSKAANGNVDPFNITGDTYLALQTTLKTELQKVVDVYGITIESTTIKDIVAPKDVESLKTEMSQAQVRNKVVDINLDTATKQQAVEARNSINKLIGNTNVANFLLRHGVDITKGDLKVTDIIDAFQKDEAGAQKLDQFIIVQQWMEKWNGLQLGGNQIVDVSKMLDGLTQDAKH